MEKNLYNGVKLKGFLISRLRFQDMLTQTSILKELTHLTEHF